MPHLVGGQPEHIDHQHTARRGRQVASVAVFSDMLLKPLHRAQPKAGGLLARHNEARAEDLHPSVAQIGIGLQAARPSHIGPDRQICMQQPFALDQFHRHLAKLTGLLTLHR